VVAGVALGGNAERAGAIATHFADILFGLFQAPQDVGRGREQPLAGRRQHQAFADAQEQRRD
jgi:hypothetical protein